MAVPKVEPITLRLTCACGASFEMSAPTADVLKFAESWRREHKGHHSAPHVVPAGATSGDVSLRLPETRSGVRA